MRWNSNYTKVAAVAGTAFLLAGLLVWAPWNRGEGLATADGPDQPEATPTPTEVEVVEVADLASPFTILTVSEDIAVHAQPGGSLTTTLSRWTHYSFDQTLLVRATQEVEGTTWYYVDLPLRPNGQRGWVSPEEFTIAEVATWAEVDLDARTITVWEDDAVVLTAPVAIGTDETPTPLGTFYVTDPVDLTANPTGVYGAYAIGLSGYSDVLEEFQGAPPQIAIHGTNQPNLIGDAVSNGCIRMTNDDVLAVAEVLEFGSPVFVVG